MKTGCSRSKVLTFSIFAKVEFENLERMLDPAAEYRELVVDAFFAFISGLMGVSPAMACAPARKRWTSLIIRTNRNGRIA